MKNALVILCLMFPLFVLGQGMNITWEDSDGREFSINTHTRQFSWSMVAGDAITYHSTYSGGPVGSVKSIGPVRVEYHNAYSGGPMGSVKSVGSVRIQYNTAYSSGPEGTVKSVGGLSVSYNNAFSGGPEGSIKSTSGSVN